MGHDMGSVRDLTGGKVSLSGAQFDPATRLLTYSARILPFDLNRRVAMNQLRSNYINGGQPTRCAGCQEPFRIVDNHIEAWRQGAYFYCSEFCAEGHDEPQRLQ